MTTHRVSTRGGEPGSRALHGRVLPLERGNDEGARGDADREPREERRHRHAQRRSTRGGRSSGRGVPRFEHCDAGAAGRRSHARLHASRCDRPARPLERGSSGGPAVVSFFRGTWCEYCQSFVRALADAHHQVRAAGAEVLALSPQCEELEGTRALPFPWLRDDDNLVARKVGVAFELPRDLSWAYRELGTTCRSSTSQIASSSRCQRPSWWGRTSAFASPMSSQTSPGCGSYRPRAPSTRAGRRLSRERAAPPPRLDRTAPAACPRSGGRTCSSSPRHVWRSRSRSCSRSPAPRTGRGRRPRAVVTHAAASGTRQQLTAPSPVMMGYSDGTKSHHT